MEHFNVSTWFLVGKGPGKRWQTDSVPNIWGYRVRPNSALSRINWAVQQVNRTPAGWPIFWIFAALAVFVVTTTTRSPVITKAIAASAFLYGIGYLFCGVSTDMRYHGWTIGGSCMACVLLAGDLLTRKVILSARTGFLAAAVIVLPSAMTIAARLVW
jgi:hypothetical protein